MLRLSSSETDVDANISVYRTSRAMATETLRQRQKAGHADGITDNGERSVEGHPGGDVKHGGFIQLLRLILFIVYTYGSSCALVLSLQDRSGHPLTI